MNGKTTLDAALLMDAIGYADGGYIQELVNELGKKRGGAHVRRIRTLSTLLAAVLIMAALTATAFAAARYFGIFDFLRGRRALPGGARELIETDITPAVQADEGFPLECEAKEALADGRSLRVVAELRARGLEELAALLSRNYEKWFVRVEKGVYALSEKGKTELKRADYAKVAAYYRQEQLGRNEETI